jgi:uncharacterized protein YndB with AHSA1/START domain
MPEFEIRREVDLPATPEQVWEAIATNAGTSAWMFPSGGDPEPHEGGTAADGSTVTAWDRPRHFGVRFEGPDGFFNALEFVLEGRAGSTVLRYVHSGVITDDWDNQYDAANQHTDFYLHTLAEYLGHFDGRPVTYIGDVPGGVNGPPESAQPGSFARVRSALGLSDEVAEGDSVKLSPPGVEPIEGVVDYVRPNFIGIRTADSLYRYFGRDAFGMPVGMSVHAFGDVDAESAKRAWQGFLNGAFA